MTVAKKMRAIAFKVNEPTEEKVQKVYDEMLRAVQHQSEHGLTKCGFKGNLLPGYEIPRYAILDELFALTLVNKFISDGFTAVYNKEDSASGPMIWVQW